MIRKASWVSKIGLYNYLLLSLTITQKQPRVGDHSLRVKVLVSRSCPTHCNPTNCSPPGSSVHGILQARILQWVAISFSRGSSQLRDQAQVSCIACRLFTVWSTREDHSSLNKHLGFIQWPNYLTKKHRPEVESEIFLRWLLRKPSKH